MRSAGRIAAVVFMAVIVSPVLANSILVPMDSQINLGLTYNVSQSPGGDAIYIPPFNSGDTQTFMPAGGSEPHGWVRHNMNKVAGGGAGGWWYQYLDLNLAGISTPTKGLDLSAPGTKIEFDARYFQDFETNPNVYKDAPIFLRLYTYADNGDTYVGYKDFGIVYATQAPLSNPQYPEWTHVVVDVNNATGTSTGGTFDITNVSRIRWYGTDWSGGGNDFVDLKRLAVTPEPGSLALLALAGFGVVRRRR